MRKLFSIFRKRKVWDFDGGIHPPAMKRQSSRTPLRQLPLGSLFVIPIKQHDGIAGELCVKTGDQVLRGQNLTIGYSSHMLPVHAPTSGKVISIAPHTIASHSALTEISIMIEPDGDDCWIEHNGWKDYYAYSRAALIDRIYQSGVTDLRDAGSPTNIELYSSGNKIRTLIINAAECEPYITADDRLMQDYAAQIVEGIRILSYILQPNEVLVGIEDNKPKAISMLSAVLTGSNDIALCIIPTKYPSGGSRQITRILTGKKVQYSKRLSDIGILVKNVSTAFAVKRAVIDGEPLTERVVTITGSAISRPGNIWTRLGTPVHYLLAQAGFCSSHNQILIMGGPLTGFTLSTLNVPVVKTTNCLLALSTSEVGKIKKEQGCIRCSACADVCPANLLPQQLYWYSKGHQHDKTKAYNLADCIECGACAWVCPSNIPLMQYFRQEKEEVSAIFMAEKHATEAKARFKARQARLEREKTARINRCRKQVTTVYSEEKSQDTINTKVKVVNKLDNNLSTGTCRKRVSPSINLHKKLVEDAIARVKARKASQQVINNSN